MFIGALDYVENVLDFRSTVFRGRTGSGKTLLACATAKYLLDTRRVRRIYSNIPFVYASSPHPDAITIIEAHGVKTPVFDFQHPTAFNSAFIMDEAWTGLGDYDKEGVRRMFGFPRKGNQIFLLTSVLELQGVRRYVFHYVDLYLSLMKIGIPFRQYHSAVLSSQNKPSTFSFLFEREFYGTFDTDARPTSLNPIEQGWAGEHRFVRQKRAGNFVNEGDYEVQNDDETQE